MIEAKARAATFDAPGQRREPALLYGSGFDGPHGLVTQLPGGEGVGVAIEDHRVRGQRSAVLEPHPAGFSSFHQHFADMGVEMEVDAQFPAQVCHSGGESMHTAIHQPDTFQLDVRDEHQRGGCAQWRGAHIGRIARE